MSPSNKTLIARCAVLILLSAGFLPSCTDKESDDLAALLAAVAVSRPPAMCDGGYSGLARNDAAGTGSVLISEIGYYRAAIGSFIEIYNGTGETISLADYSLRFGHSYDLDNSRTINHRVYNLPERKIPPGAYIVIKNTGVRGEEFSTGTYYIALNEGGVYPYISSSSYVEVLHRGVTSDFVRIGNDGTPPTTDGNWSGSGIVLSSSLSTTLQRDTVSLDQNDASDWVETNLTPGLPNLPACALDSDADGIPDCAETPDAFYMGMPLYAWGARPGRRDMFLEVDWVGSRRPTDREDWDAAIAVFRKHNIELHIDMGDALHGDGITGNAPDAFDRCGGNELVERPIDLCLEGYSCPDGVDGFYNIKAANMRPERSTLFHYTLLIRSCEADGDCYYGGIANVGGPNSILIGEYALVHELGHNLGLWHGGGIEPVPGESYWTSFNYKPNYFSTMNYRNWSKLIPGVNDHQMVYDYYYWPSYPQKNRCYEHYGKHIDYPRTAESFSDGSAAPLDERNIIESDGILAGRGLPIDFNCNGIIETTPYALDLNKDGRLTILNDHDDGAAMRIWAAGTTLARHRDAFVKDHAHTAKANRTAPISGYGRARNGSSFKVPSGTGRWIWTDRIRSEMRLPVVAD